MKHPWEVAYQTKSFSIETLAPSVVVSMCGNYFTEGDRVLDIGCGNGRNTLFLANKEVYVDSFDIADLGWLSAISENLKKYVAFTKSTIAEWKWKKNYYKGIIAARVIQYLTPEELDDLLRNVSSSLTEEGIFLLSYSESGGIHERKEIKVPKFIHTIQDVQDRLNKFFKKIEIREGSSMSRHVNYNGVLKSYDIVAYK